MLIFVRKEGYTSTEEGMLALEQMGAIPAGLSVAQELLSSSTLNHTEHGAEVVFLSIDSRKVVTRDRPKSDDQASWVCCPVIDLRLGKTSLEHLSERRIWWNATFVGVKTEN